MTQKPKTILLAGTALAMAALASGCATKKFVLNTTSPIQTKVDQVSDQTNKNGVAIDENRKEIKAVDERAQRDISAAKERAMTADTKATDAMGKAVEAGTAAAEVRTVTDRNTRELGLLRSVVANIDDYKLHGEATVLFGFSKYTLSDEGKEQLDQLAVGKGNLKRYVISVEGFTDATGSTDYNAELSQRRANAVVSYMVSKHQVPVYRIHMLGLGKDKLVDDGKTSAARSKNRRVEVRIFSADHNPEAMAVKVGTR
jgi:outer membrane protein OmpA-like peptidoglycan-associated protein